MEVFLNEHLNAAQEVFSPRRSFDLLIAWVKFELIGKMSFHWSNQGLEDDISSCREISFTHVNWLSIVSLSVTDIGGRRVILAFYVVLSLRWSLDIVTGLLMKNFFSFAGRYSSDLICNCSFHFPIIDGDTIQTLVRMLFWRLWCNVWHNRVVVGLFWDVVDSCFIQIIPFLILIIVFSYLIIKSLIRKFEE